MIDFSTQMMIELLQLIYNPTTDLVLVLRGETGQAVVRADCLFDMRNGLYRACFH